MVAMFLMFPFVKIGLRALSLEIMILMTRTVVETNDSILEELLQKDPRQSSRELAIQLNSAFNTVLNRLRALGKVQKSGKWVPNKLSEIIMNQRLTNCISLS